MENGIISCVSVTSFPPSNLFTAPCMRYRRARLYIVKIFPVKVSGVILLSSDSSWMRCSAGCAQKFRLAARRDYGDLQRLFGPWLWYGTLSDSDFALLKLL